jgi:type II secretory ATPase GspE/PulE/Tfp pilus assembly ATPase PilB-like protein
VPDAGALDTVEKIRFVTGMQVHALEAPRDAIRQRLKRIYHDPIPLPDRGVIEPPAVAVANDILRAAAIANASDVHIEPYEDGGRVRQRVDGILHFCRAITPELFAQVVSRVKLLAGMDIADKRQPQDGRYNLEVNGSSFDARVSSVPTIAGEKLAIRLLADHVQTPRLDQLNIPGEYYDALQKACKAPYGFIVAAGPTGSGKTTTLYAALSERDALSENLCSVEDPVEVRMPGVRDGETIVLGGLLRDIDSESVTRVPGLSSIPVLGKLFQERQRTHQRDEVVFLITPHIVGRSTK